MTAPTTPITITVRYFASIREAVGSGEETLQTRAANREREAAVFGVADAVVCGTRFG